MWSVFVSEHREEMVNSLQSLLRIPSVREKANPNQPFGLKIAEALQFVLDLAEQYGLKVKNLDGYIGYVEYGDSEGYVAVLSHLDVVPASGEWHTDPFGADIRGGIIYARGALDDKGPALATLWGLIAMKCLDIKPERKIRLIFGLDEETSWECVKYYFSREPAPLGGFTPVAEFPVIFAEKGMVQLVFQMPADVVSLSPTITKFEGGVQANMVPESAYALVECHSQTAAGFWQAKLLSISLQRDIKLDISVNGTRVQLLCRGQSENASMPDKGVNAIVLLASLLSSMSISNILMWRNVAAMATDGKGFGIDTKNDLLGNLTLNLGMAGLNRGIYEFCVDIRYPSNISEKEIFDACQSSVSGKWTITLGDTLKPLYVPVESPLVRTLMNVYESKTGHQLTPLAIVGATFARATCNMVAFGPLFTGENNLAHKANESWTLENYFQCVEIYAQSMLELANTL